MERVNIIKCLLSALAIVVTVMLFHSHQAVAAAAELSGDAEPQARRPRICHGDMKKLMRCCKPWIRKDGARQGDPPDSCCIPILIIDVPCICRDISPYYERIISMEKFVNVAKKCNRSIKKGTKCGSYTVPMV